MQDASWDEIRTAYAVARAGTVSGAAAALGVHHATVIRHVDALETRLGVRLFQRHARGYTPTEAGQDLLRVAAATDEQLTQMIGRLRGQGAGVSGDLIVTAVNGLSGLMVPALVRFRDAHPEVSVRYLSDSRLFRLEYGEAHVAVRAGERPSDPDNVVQPFFELRSHLCASRSYAERFGLPETEADLADHRFVGPADETHRAPISVWLRENVPAENIVFRAAEAEEQVAAVRAGAGIGFAPERQIAAETDLLPVLPPHPGWVSPIWLVTHVDLHRSPKVQAIVRFLKREAAGWR